MWHWYQTLVLHQILLKISVLARQLLQLFCLLPLLTVIKKHVTYFKLRLFWYWVKSYNNISCWNSNQFFLYISKWINMLKNACLITLCQITISACTNVVFLQFRKNSYLQTDRQFPGKCMTTFVLNWEFYRNYIFYRSNVWFTTAI